MCMISERRIWRMSWQVVDGPPPASLVVWTRKNASLPCPSSSHTSVASSSLLTWYEFFFHLVYFFSFLFSSSLLTWYICFLFSFVSLYVVLFLSFSSKHKLWFIISKMKNVLSKTICKSLSRDSLLSNAWCWSKNKIAHWKNSLCFLLQQLINDSFICRRHVGLMLSVWTWWSTLMFPMTMRHTCTALDELGALVWSYFLVEIVVIESDCIIVWIIKSWVFVRHGITKHRIPLSTKYHNISVLSVHSRLFDEWYCVVW
jgi:hypothetical protein